MVSLDVLLQLLQECLEVLRECHMVILFALELHDDLVGVHLAAGNHIAEEGSRSRLNAHPLKAGSTLSNHGQVIEDFAPPVFEALDLFHPGHGRLEQLLQFALVWLLVVAGVVAPLLDRKSVV